MRYAQPPVDMKRPNRLMASLDWINPPHRFDAVHYAGEGLGERWRMRQKLKSAASTTGWQGLPGGEVRQFHKGRRGGWATKPS